MFHVISKDSHLSHIDLMQIFRIVLRRKCYIFQFPFWFQRKSENIIPRNHIVDYSNPRTHFLNCFFILDILIWWDFDLKKHIHALEKVIRKLIADIFPYDCGLRSWFIRKSVNMLQTVSLDDTERHRHRHTQIYTVWWTGLPRAEPVVCLHLIYFLFLCIKLYILGDGYLGFRSGFLIFHFRSKTYHHHTHTHTQAMWCVVFCFDYRAAPMNLAGAS